MGTPIVLHTGALREGRGLRPLVRAMGALPAGLEATLVLLGSGPMQAELEALAREAGARVVVAPPVPPPDVPRFAAGATVGAVPLDGDALNLRLAVPNKVLEYVAAGLPVVATDLPGLRGVLVGDGSRPPAGLLVPPGDVAALAEALRKVLFDEALRSRLRSGIPGARAAYSADEARTRFLAAYARLL